MRRQMVHQRVVAVFVTLTSVHKIFHVFSVRSRHTEQRSVNLGEMDVCTAQFRLQLFTYRAHPQQDSARGDQVPTLPRRGKEPRP